MPLSLILIPFTNRSPLSVSAVRMFLYPKLHVMGTMAGLHVALTAERYAAALAAFPRAMAGLAGLLP